MTLSGHKSPIVGTYFEGGTGRLDNIYTISEDGTLVSWVLDYAESDDTNATATSSSAMADEAVSFFTGGPATPSLTSNVPGGMGRGNKSQAHHLVNATARIETRHYFHQVGAKVTATSYAPRHHLLVVGFSTGLFGLYEMPTVSNIHTLAISNNLIKTCVINDSGEWLAFGCPTTQQLLVWEWRSETYVIQQRGHAYGMRCMSYSPDGVVVCTGGEDGALKLWNATSGFCYVTLKAHTAPVTAVTFANSSVILSSSLDGTVRAHDLHRYRNFKTLTTPKPVQFLSLAVDPSGEVVTAGTSDLFEIYVWNLQTGKILDIMTGHTGPVCALAFHPIRGTLASGSWDGTVRTWDLYKKDVSTEGISHSADVVCLGFRPDGLELCTGTIGGILSFWNVEDGNLKFEIDGRRDIAGGTYLFPFLSTIFVTFQQEERLQL
jgi:periodic tryptophan protein 2